MNSALHNASAVVRKPHAVRALAACLAAAALSGCSDHTPKGQVVAVVNNQEVTVQDLQAEARADNLHGNVDPKLVLQKVLARVLLAQHAHATGVDRYPGYPSDLLRVQQTFLAEKLVQSTVKPPGTPTQAQLADVMAAHPNVFRDHARISLTEIGVPSSVDVKSLEGLDTMDAVVSRLKQLGSPTTAQTKTADTAELEAPLAAKLLSEPVGQLFFIQAPNAALAIVVQSVTPVQLPDDQANALATRLWTQAATQKQVDDQVAQLKSTAKITYQPAFAPYALPPSK